MSTFLALAAIALSGLGLASLAVRRGPLRWALAPLVGLGAWSAAYAAALFAFGSDPAVRLWKDAALALAGLAVLIAQARTARPQKKIIFFSSAPEEGQPIEDRGSRRGLWIALAAAAVLSSSLFVEHSIRHPDGGWDAWMIWNLRARSLARAGPAFRDAFSPEMLFWAHQDYPILLPGVVAQGFLLAGAQPRWIPAAVAFAFAALAVAVLAGALERLRPGGSGLLAAIALLTTPCFVGFAANQQSDVPIGAFLLGASALLALAIEGRSPRAFVLAGFCASLAAWTKNEGALCAGFFLAALGAVPWGPRRERLRAVLGYALGALPVLGLLAWFKLHVAHVNDLLHDASVQSLLDPHRWAALAPVVLRRLVFLQNWSLWLVAEVIFLLAVLPRLPPRPAARVVGSSMALALAATAVVYLLQPYELVWFVRASFDRIFLQLWPSILFATFLTLTGPVPPPRPP